MAKRPAFSAVALVANVRKSTVCQTAPRVLRLLQAYGVKVLAEPESCKAFGLSAIKPVPKAQLGARSKLLLSLGGDGTMLTAARLAAPYGVPVLGVNMGHLGFITPVPFQGLEAALHDAMAGKYRIEKRSMLQAVIYHGPKLVEARLALNDVVILRGHSAKVASLETKVDGKRLATYKADGLIVATPTGSTAYALSVGGPVLEPQSRTLLLAPISPHTLSVRPLVLADDSMIEVSAPESRAPLGFSTDGESGSSMRPGDRLVIRLYKKPALLLVPPDYDYFEVLRGKLGWRGN